MIRIWHPARDPHHCCFRILSLVNNANSSMSVARASLLDVFLVFPEYLDKFDFSGISDLKGDVKSLNLPRGKDSFSNIPNIVSTYRQMQIYQSAAARQLIAKGILSKDGFDKGELVSVKGKIPAELLQKILDYNVNFKSFLDLLTEKFSIIPIDGPGGLTRRMGIELGGRTR